VRERPSALGVPDFSLFHETDEDDAFDDLAPGIHRPR
jgi:hypothetical protein